MSPTPEQRLVALIMFVFVSAAVVVFLVVLARLLLPTVHAITSAL